MSPTDGEPRRVEVRRWRQEILDLVADLPRQHQALDFAMRSFGEDFELRALKRRSTAAPRSRHTAGPRRSNGP
jgi:hypothetical protein